MKKNISIFFTALIVLTSTFWFFLIQSKTKGDQNPENIIFTISCEDSEYLSGEAIWVNVKVINNSEMDFYFNGELILGSNLNFKVFNSNDELVDRIFLNFSTAIDDSILLSPGDTLENDQTLNWFRLNLQNRTNKFYIIAEYNNLKSNKVEFTITEPIGDEKEIFDFIKLYDKERFKLDTNGKSLDNKLIRLIETYPNSRYLPILYEQLLSSIGAFYLDSAYFNTYFHQYMKTYLNFSSTQNIVHLYKANLMNYMNDIKQIEIKLEELKIVYGNNVKLNGMINRYIKQNVKFDKLWFKK
ncbi:MAG: hypothetical protein SGI89_02415 [bacterium]|nr:hypothetical protein [bacterium]